MTTNTTWALIADRSNARIVESHGPGGPLETVAQIAHPEGRLRDRDIEADKPGRVFDRGGEGRHGMSNEELPTDRTAAQFARSLADRLRDARLAHRFDRLILAAEPRFLGMLRDALDAPTRKLVVGELPKHLLGLGDGDMRDHLREVVALV